MSGGHFTSNYWGFSEIADEIEQLIAVNGQLDKDGNGYDYPADVIGRFRETAAALRRTQAMVHAVDWLVSGDTGPESFLAEWKELPPNASADQIALAIDILDGNAFPIDWTDRSQPELLRKLCEHLEYHRKLVEGT